MASEAVNQYTTLLGWSVGFHENDPTARYLLSISPVLETFVVLAIPVGLILTAYTVGVKWAPLSRWEVRLQRVIIIVCLSATILLALGTTAAALSDFNTLHAHHIV